jgi:hypothetical protein
VTEFVTKTRQEYLQMFQRERDAMEKPNCPAEDLDR